MHKGSLGHIAVEHDARNDSSSSVRINDSNNRSIETSNRNLGLNKHKMPSNSTMFNDSGGVSCRNDHDIEISDVSGQLH